MSKKLQTWGILGIAAVLVIGVWLSDSSSSKKHGKKDDTSEAPMRSSGLSPEEVSQRVQAQELNSRTDASRTGQDSSQQPDLRLNTNPDAAWVRANRPDVPAGTVVQEDPFVKETRKREFLAPWASQVAASYRTEGRSASSLPQAGQGSTTPGNAIDNLSAQLQEALGQQQALAQQLGLPAQGGAVAQKKEEPQKPKNNVNVNRAYGKQHVLFEGSFIETVLVNRLSGDFNGPVICQVTTDLYSRNRSALLIPAGTKVLGEAKSVSAQGQSRLAVVFHRMIMPDGYAVDLDQAPALNQVGETALKDKVNNHYFKIFGSSIAIGAIAGFTSAGTQTTGYGQSTSYSDAYRQGVSDSLSQSSMHILDKFLNLLPTITIREGHRVKVYITQDLVLPNYSNHAMDPNL
jgi:type IV secretion system protein VirB10